MDQVGRDALAAAKAVFADYKKGKTTFEAYIIAFNRACGLTGFSDADVWELLNAEA